MECRMTPIILGFSGTHLTADESSFFRDANPAGYILFGRNCVEREQVRGLTDDLQALSGRADVPILIDQEGGRIVRLKPPVWPELPGAAIFDRLYRRAPMSAVEAMRLHGHAIAVILAEVGINVNCAPLLDLRHADSHPIIAERALGEGAMQVAALGRAMLDGMRAGGVAGIVKHMPGQGRAIVDSHNALPTVNASQAELEDDLEAFRKLAWAPIAMTAHVVYSAWDAGACATLSSAVIADVIRGRIGFDGLLISDDIAMGALSGGFAQRGRSAIAAGCDLVLHCSADLAEMRELAGALGETLPAARDRLARAMAWASGPATSPSYDELAAQRDALLAYA
jgi:beta-N-acetylhexosaminidase